MTSLGRNPLGNDDTATAHRELLADHLRVRGLEVARSIVDAWLASEFEAGRSAPKVAKLKALGGSGIVQGVS
jgi:hypothetical protein